MNLDIERNYAVVVAMIEGVASMVMVETQQMEVMYLQINYVQVVLQTVAAAAVVAAVVEAAVDRLAYLTFEEKDCVP